ncbi:probable G-protein coupled receptor 148 [Erpetoichthys calabaricus]|nr:probable G-protein coupled receptor 148 [Erpetoichthys calabaricus]
MNVSNGTDNGDNTENIVKTWVQLVDFLSTSFFSCLIIKTIQAEAELKQQVRYILLNHHLISVTFYFGTGFIFHCFRIFRADVPRIVCWMTFSIHITFARGILLTLTLMAANTYLAVCWPLRYKSFVHTIKRKALIMMWILALLHPLCSMIQSCTEVPVSYFTERDLTCPSVLDSTLSKSIAMLFIFLLLIVIALSYFLIYREGRRSGHFTTMNVKGRRTILIHGLQIILHIVPTFIILAVPKTLQAFRVFNFIIFAVAQGSSPIIYGLRCRDIKSRLPKIPIKCCS